MNRCPRDGFPVAVTYVGSEDGDVTPEGACVRPDCTFEF